MEYTRVHRVDMNHIAQQMFADGLVPWRDALPPKLTGGIDERSVGSLRSCGYCGSMHPADVAAAIKSGAVGEWADRKYGWPHKAYFTGIPNPHAGMLESRSGRSWNYPMKPEEMDKWRKVQNGFNRNTGEPTYVWKSVGEPAGEKTSGKFYTIHLQDADPADRSIIEGHLGLTFIFEDEGARVKWFPV